MEHNKPLTDAQRMLVEEHLGLIHYAINKIPVYLLDSREDAFQIGAIGLMKAARAFDPERKLLFATFAVPCIVNELRMAIRHTNSSNPHGRTFSYDANLNGENGEGFSLIDLIPSGEKLPEEQYALRETLGEIVTALKNMRDRDAYIILQMIVRNCKQEEIAKSLGITQSAVSRKLRRIRSVLQMKLME